ncbi:hypothetical protein K1719_026335 [Acacia pycnantha]|nr:hypothetical protein K1719_026335 [Acacia pycnantha]
MQSPILQNPQDIVNYNKDQLSSIDYVQTTTHVNVPFPCDCIGSEFLGYIFKYPIQAGDNYVKVVNQSYSKLRGCRA